MVIQKFLIFPTHDYWKLIVNKTANTGVLFYFIDFEANFQDQLFLGSNCFKALIWHLIQILQLVLNLIKLGN